MNETPEDIRKTAEEVASTLSVEAVDSDLHDGDTFNTERAAPFIARAIMEERERSYVRGLEDAKGAIHCGCTNYCDFDEAEEKIDELIDAIRQPHP